jgi:hypothetical protein
VNPPEISDLPTPTGTRPDKGLNPDAQWSDAR